MRRPCGRGRALARARRRLARAFNRAASGVIGHLYRRQLLVAAAALLVAAEWPRVAARAGVTSSSRPGRRRKPHLHVVSPDSDEFARSVERDLARLPTIDDRDAKKRR